jgi:hypothetical protein
MEKAHTSHHEIRTRKIGEPRCTYATSRWSVGAVARRQVNQSMAAKWILQRYSRNQIDPSRLWEPLNSAMRLARGDREPSLNIQDEHPWSMLGKGTILP